MAAAVIVLAVYDSRALIGSLAEFVECLQGVQSPMDLAPSGFLGHAVEMVLTISFKTLWSAALPGRSASNPGECVGLLKKEMAKIVLLALPQVALSEAVARCNN